MLCLNNVNLFAFAGHEGAHALLGDLILIVYDWVSKANRVTGGYEQKFKAKIKILCTDIVRFVAVLFRLPRLHAALMKNREALAIFARLLALDDFDLLGLELLRATR